MFEKFETMSRAEREQVAENLTALYSLWYELENVRFLEMRHAKPGAEYDAAQRRYIDAAAKLGTIQTVFSEMGIDPDTLEIPF